jgi:hypothetical protein
MPDVIVDIWKWIKEDHKAWPLRFYLEIAAWLGSIGCSLTMAFTLPHPPFLILYPLFIIQCLIFCWAAWTRKSFGMMANYILLVSIDSLAYIRLVLL